MLRTHRITIHVAIVVAMLVAGCKNKKEVHAAKHSAYDAEFAVVFSAALAAVRDQYKVVDDFPQNALIKTAWQEVSLGNSQDELANPRTLSAGQGVPAGGAPMGTGTGVPTRLAYKRQFIRFEVTVVGGRPWRVKVMGTAAEWDPGNAMPTELRGPARPPWLDGRIESLQVAIYRKIRQHAVPLKEAAPIAKPGTALPTTDPSTIKGVPEAAAKTLAAIKDAIARRDPAALRAAVAEDVVWSLGGAPGADTAMAMWQADPDSLETMSRLIAGGCGSDDKRVRCPAGQPGPAAWQLVLELRGADWKIASFVRAE